MKLELRLAKQLVEFLDRVPIQGHQERSDMNEIVKWVVAAGNSDLKENVQTEEAK